MKRKEPSKNWIEKLPKISRGLEHILYSTASSHEEYSDVTTISARIKNVAVKLASRKQKSAKDRTEGSSTLKVN